MEVSDAIILSEALSGTSIKLIQFSFKVNI